MRLPIDEPDSGRQLEVSVKSMVITVLFVAAFLVTLTAAHLWAQPQPIDPTKVQFLYVTGGGSIQIGGVRYIEGSGGVTLSVVPGPKLLISGAAGTVTNELDPRFMIWLGTNTYIKGTNALLASSATNIFVDTSHTNTFTNVVAGAGVVSLSGVRVSIGTNTPAATAPAGGNLQIQYNDNGMFGADPNLFWLPTGPLTLQIGKDSTNSTAIILVNAQEDQTFRLNSDWYSSYWSLHNKHITVAGEDYGDLRIENGWTGSGFPLLIFHSDGVFYYTNQVTVYPTNSTASATPRIAAETGSENGWIDARHHLLRNLLNPKTNQDAVTLNYANSNYASVNITNVLATTNLVDTVSNALATATALKLDSVFTNGVVVSGAVTNPSLTIAKGLITAAASLPEPPHLVATDTNSLLDTSHTNQFVDNGHTNTFVDSGHTNTFLTSSNPIYTNSPGGASLLYDTKIGCLCVSNPTWGILPLNCVNLYATAPASDTTTNTDYFTSATTNAWISANVGATWTISHTNNRMLMLCSGETVDQPRMLLRAIPVANSNWTAVLTIDRFPYFSTDNSAAPQQRIGLVVTTNSVGGTLWMTDFTVQYANTTLLILQSLKMATFTTAGASDTTGSGDNSILLVVPAGIPQIRMVYTASTTNIAYSYAMTQPGASPQWVSYFSTTPTSAIPTHVGIVSTRVGSGDSTKASSVELKAFQFNQ